MKQDLRDPVHQREERFDQPALLSLFEIGNQFFAARYDHQPIQVEEWESREPHLGYFKSRLLQYVPNSLLIEVTAMADKTIERGHSAARHCHDKSRAVLKVVFGRSSKQHRIVHMLENFGTDSPVRPFFVLPQGGWGGKKIRDNETSGRQFAAGHLNTSVTKLQPE